MPVISPNSVSVLPSDQRSGGSLKEKGVALTKNTLGRPDADLWSTAGEALANAQSQIDHISKALRAALPQPQVIQITDPNGALVAEIGNLTGTNNQAYPGIWGRNLYVGGTGPDTAPFFANGQQVIIGQNGQVYVLDPYGNIGAWLGTQSETAKNVTGAVNAAGAIRLTVVAHGWVTGDQINVKTVGGVPNATGQWVITVSGVNTVDLIGSTFAGVYTAGGTAQRYFTGGLFSTIAVGGAQRITNVANNGSGGVRITVPTHGYATGYAVVLTEIQGVPNINGVSWPITVINANAFDLVGAVFSGAYTGGGFSLNWPTAKLIARDDGSLTINGATIILTSNGTETIINNNVSPFTGLGVSLESIDIASGWYSIVDPFHFAILTPANNPYARMEVVVIGPNAFGGITLRGDPSQAINLSTGATPSVSITDGVTTVTVDAANVDAVTYSVSGTPGIDFTSAFGTSVTVGTASFGVSLTVNTGTAVTNVTGVPGLVLSTGTFVTGVTLNVANAVNSVVLNTSPNTFQKGLLTA